MRPIYLRVSYLGQYALDNGNRQEKGEGMPPLNISHVVIHQKFSYLEETIRGLLGGMKDVMVVIERRRGERRKFNISVPLERRLTLPDRRKRPDKMVSVVINIPVEDINAGDRQEEGGPF